VAEFVEQSLRMIREWRNIEIMEMSVKKDNMHMILSIPLKIINIRSNGNAKR